MTINFEGLKVGDTVHFKVKNGPSMQLHKGTIKRRLGRKIVLEGTIEMTYHSLDHQFEIVPEDTEVISTVLKVVAPEEKE